MSTHRHQPGRSSTGRRLRLLDLCCGVGGAAKGYQHAGFHVTGVDRHPQPRYCGDAFTHADALAFLAEHGHRFDRVHASFPCQTHCSLTKGNRARGLPDDHVDLIAPGRVLLDATGLPYVLENVQGSPLRRDLTLCGETALIGRHLHTAPVHAAGCAR